MLLFVGGLATLGPQARPLAATATADLNVVINGTAVVFDQPPLARGGRVYVPLRGIFERLGASVVFTAGHIIATAGRHSISLTLDRTRAIVDGAVETLEAPPLVVAGRTLVPLRFVSQALGATVAYDAASRTVNVTAAAFATQAQPADTASLSPSASPAASEAPLPPPVPTPFQPERATIALRPGETPIALRLLRLEPAPQTTLARRRPEISATFAEPVDPTTVRVELDGTDVTARTSLDAHSFTLDPPADLEPGPHEISLAGRTPDREAFVSHWDFTTRDGPDTNFVSGLEPANGVMLGSTTFTVSGYTRPHARVRIVGTTSAASEAFADASDASQTVDAVANANGYFAATLALVDRGSGIVDVRVASTTPAGDIAVRTLRLRQ